MQIRDFIPPIVSKALRGSQSPAVLTRYRSYEEALAGSDSYEAADIIEVVSRKTRIFRDQLTTHPTPRVIDNQLTLQSAFVASYVNPGRKLHVLEMGGACGAGYLQLVHLLPDRFADWRIVETPAMTKAGQDIFRSGTLTFFDDLNVASQGMSSRDLVMAQGVVQYTPDPVKTLTDLFKLNFDYVYISRTPVVDAPPTTWSVIFNSVSDLSAHGHGRSATGVPDRKITTPCTIISRSGLVDCCPSNYRQKFWFEEPEQQEMLIGSERLSVRNVGCLFARA